MRWNFFWALILMAVTGMASLRAQQSDGMRTLGRTASGTTRAVVIGISTYGEGIRSLQFAHRDAEAFADFLRSKAGGELPDDHIRILLNQQATLAAIDDALFWLKTTSQKGDKAIVYFSGHGDVETDAHWDFGYLLASDSPPNNFRNNAVRVEDLDILAIELSTVREARTLFIIDACRSGTLSEGRQVPHTHLANQRANEVRILSCRPDQVSIEGAQWGSGRGVFSWHLLRGLKGLAEDPDLDNDPEIVTLEELDLFLRKNLRRATQNLVPPQYQDPMVSGPERFLMAQVDADILAEVRAEDLRHDDLAGAFASRGAEVGTTTSHVDQVQSQSQWLFDWMGHSAQMDQLDMRPLLKLKPMEVPAAFLTMVEDLKNSRQLSYDDRQMLEGLQVEQMIPARDDKALDDFNHRLAVLLHNHGQVLINRYLRTDQSDITERSYQKDKVSAYVRHPAIFELALMLLPEDHPLSPRLRVKHLYYTGLARRLLATQAEDFKSDLEAALALQMEALALDDKAPYIQNELGILHKWLHEADQLLTDAPPSSVEKANWLEQAEAYFREAIRLAPSWGLPYSNLAGLHLQLEEYEAARKMTDLALERVPQYFGVHLLDGLLHLQTGDLLYAEDAFLRAHRLNTVHYMPHRELGLLYLHTHDFEKAETQWHAYASKIAGIVHFVPINYLDGISHLYDQRPLIATPYLPETDDPVEIFEHARALMETDRLDEAEVQLKRIIAIDSDFPLLWDQLGWLYYRQRNFVSADHSTQIALRKKNHPDAHLHMLHARVLWDWGHLQAAIQSQQRAVALQPNGARILKELGRMYEQTGRLPEAEAAYQRLFHIDANSGANALYRLYDNQLQQGPHDTPWMQRMATLLYPYCKRVYVHPHVTFDESNRPVHFFPIHSKPSGTVETYYEQQQQPYEESLIFELDTWPHVCVELDKWVSSLLNIEPAPEERSHYLTMRSLVHAKRGLLAHAIEDMEEALMFSSDTTSIWERLVYLHRQLPSPLPEIHILRELYKSGRLRYPDHLQLAEGWIRQGHFAAGDSLLNEGARRDLEGVYQPRLQYARALNHWLSGEIPEAKTLYMQLLDTPMGAQAAYALARIDTQMAQPDDYTQSLAWMDLAISKGWRHTELLRHDPVMTPVRGSDGWAELMRRHPSILRQ
jgi:tetratricopeptide (TPR) repeat protein